MKRKPKTLFSQAIYLIMFAVLFAALFSHLEMLGDLFAFLVDILNPVLVGGLLAFFLNVPMRAMENLFARLQTKRGKPVRERLNAIISLILTYILIPLILGTMISVIIPQLVKAVPGVVSSVEAAWPRFLALLHKYNIETDSLENLLQSIDLGKVITTITNNLDTIWETSVSAVSSVVDVLTVAITGIVISVYILANKPKLMRQSRKMLYAYLPESFARRAESVAILTNKTFSSFLGGQCMECLILGVMFFIVLSILRIPFALVISVFIAVTALIPYVGAFLGCLLGALLILTVSPGKALIFLIVFFVLQQVEGQLIYPKVMGASVGLSPMWVLISVFVGGKLFGLIGMVFFIPVVSVVYTLLRSNVDSRLLKRKLKVEPEGVVHGEDTPETPATETLDPESPEPQTEGEGEPPRTSEK